MSEVAKLKPFDILSSSWGYDQTNVDYYSVVRATDKTVWLQPIRGHMVSSEGGSMCGYSVPVPGAFKGEQLKRKIKVYNDRVLVRISGYEVASKLRQNVDGSYGKSYVSWYA